MQPLPERGIKYDSMENVIEGNTELEILRGNLLICNFMNEGIIAVRAQYHTSWDWLMPVVEKLQEPEVKNNKVIREIAEVAIYYKNCKIEYTEEFTEYEESRDGEQGETKIEAVWKAVVKFIKWYNTQTK